MGIYVLVRAPLSLTNFSMSSLKGAVFSARGQRRVFQCFLAADPAALWLPGALANGRRVELMDLLATASP